MAEFLKKEKAKIAQKKAELIQKGRDTLQRGRDRISGPLSNLSRIDARLQQSYLGNVARVSTLESFGFHFSGSVFGASGTVNNGFLGIKGSLNEMRARRGPNQTRAPFQPSRVYGTSRAFGASKVGAAMDTARYAGRGAKPAARFAGSTAMKSLGLLSTGVMAYQGYQDNGVVGAAMGVGESIAYTAAFRGIGGAIFNPVSLGLAGGAAVGYGVYQTGEAASRHVKGLRNIEMGDSAIMDALNTPGAATSRQRAVSALQNTHLNGRMAMGNEALLLHTSFR